MIVKSLYKLPKDDGRLARRTARRLGVRLLIPRIRLTRFDEPPASHDETEDNGALIEIGPDTPPPQPRGVDEQVGVRLQGRQEPLRPLRQRGIAGCEIGSPPGLAGGREIYVGFFGSSSGLSLRERWHLRCEELFGPLPPPLSPAFPAHLEQMFNLRISGSENLDLMSQFRCFHPDIEEGVLELDVQNTSRMRESICVVTRSSQKYTPSQSRAPQPSEQAKATKSDLCRVEPIGASPLLNVPSSTPPPMNNNQNSPTHVAPMYICFE
ncbi:hypothetical protein V9T40_014552 [Parthenolecanium corni]|uniref:Uncharacterized protein n=1 Tax=Parthenolecanium corni TaxID=536013 RepID=A0AAN9T731_9HEMI